MATTPNDTSAQAQFKWANSLFQSGDYGEALDLLMPLAREYPKNSEIVYAQARCLMALRRIEEARSVATHLHLNLGSARGERLLERIDRGDYGVQVEPPSLERDEPPARAPSRRVQVKPRRIAALLGVGLAVIGSGIAYRVVTDPARLRSTVSQTEMEAAKSQLNARRDETARKRQGQLEKQQEVAESDRLLNIALAEGPVDRPGIEHPPEVWQHTAIDGVPQWKPGIYKRIPCKSNAAYTLDVYIPMAYQMQPAAYFPAIMISMPEGNPAFQGFKEFAEKKMIILVAINNSSNATYGTNKYAQELAFYTVLPSLRVDPRLGFTYGASGGARTGWECAVRNPENFAGLLQVAFGGYGLGRISPHVRVAFLHADRDFNNKDIAYTIRRLKADGHEVREIVFPGDHYTIAPADKRIELMEWLASSARGDYGLAHPP
ncbi:MAG: tetratricopeptide repeat protein [Candidatus Hydrogenedentes bacterium]|nr:tetratricopeptide repeat protein [Candidatus Hydrogenedentota bacterium]